MIDTSELSGFPDVSVKETVSNYCLKKGYIDGAEYVSITADEDGSVEGINIFGIEDKKLYMQNVQAFLRSQKVGADLDHLCTSLQETIANLKNHIYPKKLHDFDGSVQEFHNGEQDFDAYCYHLKNMADDNMIDYEHLHQFRTFINLHQFEKEIDFARADTERQLAVRSVSKILSKDDAIDLLRKEIDFKTNVVSLTEYLSCFNDVCIRNDVCLDDFPEFKKLIEYTQLYLKINQDNVLAEALELEKLLFSELIDNPDQRMLHEVSEFVAYIVKFFHISFV